MRVFLLFFVVMYFYLLSMDSSLKELKDAVKFVAENSTGDGDSLFEDPDKIMKFFDDMDTVTTATMCLYVCHIFV